MARFTWGKSGPKTLLPGSSPATQQSLGSIAIQNQSTHLVSLYPDQARPNYTDSGFFTANTTGAAGWDEALQKAQAFVSLLTLEEKADMVTGVPGPCVGNIYPIPRLNFSGLCLQDGPVSLRTADYVSVFPAGVTIASSWDKEIMYERSLAMGREFRAKGAHIALA